MQVLKILKQQIDAELPDTDESLEIVDMARSFLVDREFRLVNMRKNAIESAASGKLLNGGGSSMTSSLSQTTPMQLTPSSSYDPFKRQDGKRKSISNSFSNIFRRPGSVGKLGSLNTPHIQCVLFVLFEPHENEATTLGKSQKVHRNSITSCLS